MKLLLSILLVSCLLFSCDTPDKKDTTVTELQSLQRPDVDLDWELGYKDTTGDYAVLKQVNGKGTWVTIKDTTWQKQIKVPRSTFLLQMSSRQVTMFLKASHYFGTKLILGIVLLIMVLGIIIYILYKNAWHITKASFGGLVAVVFIIGGCIRIIQKTPSEMSALNKKSLNMAEYNHWLKVDPSFDTYWKEKWEKNELVGITNKK